MSSLVNSYLKLMSDQYLTTVFHYSPRRSKKNTKKDKRPGPPTPGDTKVGPKVKPHYIKRAIFTKLLREVLKTN